MIFKKIERTTASEKIVGQILDNIKQGDIKPGEELPSEKELAEMFGVSRASVREATRALTIMGYITVQQGKRASLREELPVEGISTDKLGAALAAGLSIDLVDIRNLLECKAVALASQRANASDLDRVRDAVDKMEGSRDRPADFFAADMEFHLALAQASNNDILVEIMDLIRNRMIQDRELFLGTSDTDILACTKTARETYEVVKAGDAEEAVRKMAAHLQLVSTEIEKIIQSSAIQGVNGKSAVS